MFNAFSSLLSLASYVLLALGMYTIAKRRGIQHAWLAWVPVANVWLLGCVSDQYQQVARGKQKAKRRTMMWLYVIMIILVIVLVVVAVNWFVGLLDSADIRLSELVKDPMAFVDTLTDDLEQTQSIDELPTIHVDKLTGDWDKAEDYLVDSLGQLLVIGGLGLALSILSVILTVLQYMAYYDVFRSCNPEKATMFLVVSIVMSLFGLGIVEAILVFVCRDKDLGMPPRADQNPEQSDVWLPPQPSVEL